MVVIIVKTVKAPKCYILNMLYFLDYRQLLVTSPQKQLHRDLESSEVKQRRRVHLKAKQYTEDNIEDAKRKKELSRESDNRSLSLAVKRYCTVVRIVTCQEGTYFYFSLLDYSLRSQ
jgi:hypothetical protein